MEEENIPLEEEYEDSEFESETVSPGPKPTASELLLTPEERLARREYQMKASICCVNEAWRMYKRVTQSEDAIEPANLTTEGSNSEMVTRMGVLYDPTAGLRMRFLKKKFAHLIDGFTALRQAAYKPFIRCQRPKKVDIDGQGFVMPAVVKTFYPEVSVNYVHPSTFAYKEKWSKTYNSNIVSIEDILRDQEHKQTQSLQADVYSTKRIRRKEKERDLSVEKFDIEDIPLDSDGNPIGRSVGICEWCGKSILPIPNEYTLQNEWNIESLYCCHKYRLFIEDVKKATHILEAEHEKKRLLINVSAKKNRFGGGKKKETTSDTSTVVHKTKRAIAGNMIKILEDKITEELEEQERTANVAVDTFDLPWDPAETRYHQQLRVNAERKSLFQGKDNLDLLLMSEEVYAN